MLLTSSFGVTSGKLGSPFHERVEMSQQTLMIAQQDSTTTHRRVVIAVDFGVGAPRKESGVLLGKKQQLILAKSLEDLYGSDWPENEEDPVELDVKITFTPDGSAKVPEYEFTVSTISGKGIRWVSATFGETIAIKAVMPYDACSIYAILRPAESQQQMPQNRLEAEFSVAFKLKDESLNTQKLLWNHLQDVCSTELEAPYSAWLNVVQSSGTGKTRAVFQLGKAANIPVYYVRGDDGGRGYPANTPAILNFLAGDTWYVANATFSVTDEDADVAAYCRAVAFMYAAFEKSVDSQAGHGEMDWDAVNKTQWEMEASFWDIEEMKDRSKALKTEMTKLTTWGDREDVVYAHFADILKRQSKKIAPTAYEGITFIVLIDECRYLRRRVFTSSAVGSKLDVLAHLGRAARVLRKGAGGVMVSIDTLPNVVGLSARAVLPSDRARGSPGTNKQMVFTRLLTWDLSFTEAKTLGAVLSKRHIVSCGRPLWSAMWQVRCVGMQMPQSQPDSSAPGAAGTAGGQEGLKASDDIVTFIQTKLLCSNKLDKPSPAQAAATVCSRVALDLNPYTQLARDLVGSHMAHLDYYDYEKGLAVTSYLPEAPLAYGARHLWRPNSETKQQDHLTAALREINKLVQAREVQPGERVEVTAAQIVVLDALDEVAVREGGVVTVENVLQVLLFGGDKGGGSEGPRNNNIGGLKATKTRKGSGAAAMLSGVINVVQFVRIEYTPSRTDLYHFFQRGLGVVAKTNAASADLYLPVMLEMEVPGDTMLDAPTVIQGQAHAAWARGGSKGSSSGKQPSASGVKAGTGARDRSSGSMSASYGGGPDEPSLKKQKTDVPGKGAQLEPMQPETNPPRIEPVDVRHRALSPRHVTVLALQVKNTQAQDTRYIQKVNPAVDIVRGLGANTPFGFALLSFNLSEEVEVYGLPIDDSVPVKDSKVGMYLSVAVSNPHLRRSPELAEQLAEMVQGAIHPVQLLQSGEDAMAMMVEQVTRYGTVMKVEPWEGALMTEHGKLSDH